MFGVLSWATGLKFAYLLGNCGILKFKKTKNRPAAPGRPTPFNPNSEVGDHARPGRRWTRPRVQHVAHTVFENAWNFSVRPGFPRGRGKLRPGRERSRSISEFRLISPTQPVCHRTAALLACAPNK